MTTQNDYCVFILSHGRPDKVLTFASLEKQGYTGKVVIVIDDEDSQRDKYVENFSHVETFNKAEVAKDFDLADNFTGQDGVVVYARNACFAIAKKLGYEYFIQLDDDYQAFEYRVYEVNATPKNIKNLDRVFGSLFAFYKSITANSIAIAQGGDFIGGMENRTAKKPTLFRKCMNTFFCSTDRVFRFAGRINEDVNTYTHGASTGLLFFTVPFASVVQMQTQASSGGMSELYLDQGTYVKSFYSVIFQPSSVTVRMMGDSHKRLHHWVKWDNTAPKILREQVKRK